MVLLSVNLQYQQPKVVSFFVIYKGGWLFGDTLHGGHLHHKVALKGGFGFRGMENERLRP